MDDEELYPCIGICTPDPDSGCCLGCGRPPLESPAVVHSAVPGKTGAENDPTLTAATPPD